MYTKYLGLTNERNILEHILCDCSPCHKVSLPLNHSPEEHPVKVGHMVHDEQTAFLKLPIVAKGSSFNSK